MEVAQEQHTKHFLETGQYDVTYHPIQPDQTRQRRSAQFSNAAIMSVSVLYENPILHALRNARSVLSSCNSDTSRLNTVRSML